VTTGCEDTRPRQRAHADHYDASADHYDASADVRRHSERVIEMQPPERFENGLPVLASDFGASLSSE